VKPYLSDTVLAHVETVSEAPDLHGTRYELLEPLGRGGMGSVWLARDTGLEREVALKVSAWAPGPELADRLQREAKVLAQLEHPGIVPVHDSVTLPDGRVFYVMKRVRGQRLDAWAEGRDVRAKLRLFQRICEAVAFAHANGVLHRDLKPQNVMVGAFGEALVMDWGLAKLLSEADAAGTVLGTPGFMAPEQARGEPVGEAADVYGLGAVLRALLVENVPPPLAAVCAKATAEAPAQRYASAQELCDDVGRWLDLEPVLARRESAFEKTARFISKNRVVLSLLAAYVLVRLALLLL
jgi:serine/threonine protein kinase